MKKYMVKESQYKPLENKIIGLESLGVSRPKKPKKPSKLDLILKRLDQIDTNQQDTNSRLDQLEQRVGNIEQRVDGIDTTLKTVIRLNNLKTE